MTSPAVTPDEMRRLAFIKYLYSVAVEQSQRPEPMKAAALLMFHDAVELFLYLATQHLNVAEKKLDFAGYFTVIKKKLPGGRMPREGKVLNLNDERIGLKHYGYPPHPNTVDEFRNDVTTFFEENTPLIFDGLEFADISMVDLVSYDGARMELAEAEHMMQDGRLENALDKVATAFAILLHEHNEKIVSLYGESPYSFGSPFSFGNPFGFLTPGLPRIDDFSRLGNALYDMKEALHRVERAMTVLTLGLDYHRFGRFQLLTPPVGRGMDGTFMTERDGSLKPPSPDECRFCFDFVIKSALRLQEFDFDVE